MISSCQGAKPPRPTYSSCLQRVARERAGTDESLGGLGRPFDRRTPFFVGLTGALGGFAVAYLLVRGIIDITSVLVIIGRALLIAIGLNPILEFLIKRGMARGASVGVVAFAFVVIIAGFLVAAVPPISHEISNLVTNYPRYKADLIHGRGWAGRLAVKLHLSSYLKSGGGKSLKLPVTGGVLGPGKIVLSFAVATVSLVALTIYFLIPRSRA